MSQSATDSQAVTRRRWFESAMQLLVVYSIACYYLETELTEAGYIAADTTFWLWNERVIAALFTGEYLYRWATAANPLRYPFSILALIDMAAILPFYLSLMVDLRTLRLIRTLRVLRLFKLYRYNAALQNVLSGFRKVKDELAVVGFVVVVVIIFSAVGLYEFEHEVQPEKFRRLSDSVWWAFVTLTTVGYGDMYPITLGGRAIAVLTMVIGIGVVGTFISLIGSSFLSTMREEARHHYHHHHHHLSVTGRDTQRESDPIQVPWLEDTVKNSDRAA
ncbi:MAG TPA: ion transporter [Pirellulales bacterium]|nr:ion transporter [Pirellulales bacterium]